MFCCKESMNDYERQLSTAERDRADTITRGYEPVSASSVAAALKKLDGLRAGGSTNLFDGLNKAVESLDSDRTTAVLLVTDGVANVGPTELGRFVKEMHEVHIANSSIRVQGTRAGSNGGPVLTSHPRRSSSRPVNSAQSPSATVTAEHPGHFAPSKARKSQLSREQTA